MENYISQASLFQKFKKIHYEKLASGGEEEINPSKVNPSKFEQGRATQMRSKNIFDNFGIGNVYDESYPRNSLDSHTEIFDIEALKQKFYKNYIEEELKNFLLEQPMKSGMNNLYKNLHNEHFLLKM